MTALLNRALGATFLVLWFQLLLSFAHSSLLTACDGKVSGDSCARLEADYACSTPVTGTCTYIFGPGSPLYCADTTSSSGDCGATSGACFCFNGICFTTGAITSCDDPQVGGDPHLVGFKGQRFDVTGQDEGIYNLVHDGECNIINMRVSALPGMPAITYITALGMILCGKDGNKHTVEIMVKDPHNLETSCPSDYVCLADGALTVLLDSKEIMGPGTFDSGNGVVVTAANIPGECRPFGFEKYWMAQQDKDENNAINGRRLEEVFPMSEWLMRDTLRTNPRECDLYVNRAAESDSLFDHQSEHTSFQTASPHLSLRVNHGKIHQIAMRDPTDTLDLPDHVAYQMNLAFRKIQLGDDPRGILGETVHPVLNESGAPIMEGPKALRADEESYRVHCLLCSEFVQLLEL